MAGDEHGEASPENDSPVVAALGLEEASLEETLAWARSRCEDLLSTLDDHELLALLASNSEQVVLESLPVRAESIAALPPRSPERGEARPSRSPSPRLRTKTPRPEEWVKAYPRMRAPPAMGPTQVHPRAIAPPSPAEPAATRAPARPHVTLKLGTLVEPSVEPESLVDATELDGVDLPEVDWGPQQGPGAPDRDAPIRRRVHDRQSYHDAAHQSSPSHRASGPERRNAPRYSLTEPAVIEVRDWSELVTLYVRDISSGGMFVGTTAPPAPGVEVTVQLLLPDEAGTLDFDGRVVRVVTPDQATASGQVPGFGIQFLGLTPLRHQALERLIEQAELSTKSPDTQSPRLSTLGLSGNPGPAGGLRLTLSASERRQMQQLRAELEAMSERGDLELLGLREPGTSEQLRASFERLVQRWHPDVTHRDAPSEVRALATEIFLRIERAYRRLCDGPRPASASGRDAARPSRTNPSRSASSRAPKTRASQARRVVDDLLDRGEKLTDRLKHRGQRALSEEERHELVDEALDMISAKRYRDAGRLLMKVIRDRPELRLRVLLRVINARQALTDRDYARARNCYLAVLELDPNNALAKQELTMLKELKEN